MKFFSKHGIYRIFNKIYKVYYVKTGIMAKPGDKVKVVCKDEEITGVLMPSEAADSVIVKLDSGYNMGIEKKKIREIKVLEPLKEAKEKVSEKTRQNPKLPTIAILHTGGTIASKVDYRTGGVIARFSPEELFGMFPELGKIANIKSRLISNMFSEDMRFAHYKLMAKAIEEEYDEVDGIILTHGTDTMAYTSAALAFMLEGLGKPVIMVGAQRSSDRGSSDAAVNLICAAQFIANSDFAGVAICMHENSEDNDCLILPATKTRKLHSSRRDAFKAVNDTAIAKVHYKDGKVEFLKKEYGKRSGSKLAVRDGMEEKVAILKVHPNMFPEQFSFFKGYKGLVIEGTGLGQAPVGVPNELCRIHEKNLKAIEELVKSDTVVVMTSQTIFGRVHMHVYSNAIDLVNVGVIPGEDMLAETAFIKLAWLLGNYPKEKVKGLVVKDLRGEITERTEYEKEFI